MSKKNRIPKQDVIKMLEEDIQIVESWLKGHPASIVNEAQERKLQNLKDNLFDIIMSPTKFYVSKYLS